MPSPPSLPHVPYADVVLVQAFGWDSHRESNPSFWRRLAADGETNAGLAQQLAAVGATHVWLPPPSASVAPEGYLPGQLYDIDGSAYGTARDLKDACANLLRHGVRPVADVVINHRCADQQDEKGRWNQYADTREEMTEMEAEEEEEEGEDAAAAPRRPKSRVDWGRWAITADDPHFGGQGNPDSGADFEGAPDLDHHNPELRAALVDWLVWLRDEFGFAGWRLDYAKGYASEYAGEYIARSLPLGSFCVGELWCDLRWGSDGKPEPDQGEARQALCDWVDGCRRGGGKVAAAEGAGAGAAASAATDSVVPGDAAAFDFVTKGVLQAALASGELWRLRDARGGPPGLGAFWPSRCVKFVDNHDTGSSQQHWPCPKDCLQAAYAYVLTHPSIPCLFGEHFLGRSEDDPLRHAIEALMRARRDARCNADSRLVILRAEQDLYVADVYGGAPGAESSRRLRVKLGAAMDMGDALPREEDGWALAASGERFAVWMRQE
jgi:alpha-amylase